jgi:hypothetical protein
VDAQRLLALRLGMQMRWLLLTLAALPAFAQERVDPAISVTDINGRLVHPFQTSGKAASVIFFVTNDCPISNIYAREIHRICDAYADRASCLLDYIDPTLTVPQVAKHIAEYGHGNYPAVIDKKHLLVKAAGATTTPEAAVIAGGKIAYRGRIDNLYVRLGQARPKPTQFDLRAALDAVIAGRTVELPRTPAIGCSITPIELLTHTQ